jgi:hypothetical protein
MDEHGGVRLMAVMRDRAGVRIKLCEILPWPARRSVPPSPDPLITGSIWGKPMWGTWWDGTAPDHGTDPALHAWA